MPPGSLPSPASRSSTPAGLDTARRRPDRPGSPPHRSADLPPSRHRPARIPRIGGSARFCGPAQPGSGPVRSARSPLSAAHQRSVRCDSALNLPARSMSPPLRPAGSRLRRPVRDPRHPHPGPPLSSRRGQGRARTHMPRACGVGNFRKKIRERGGAPCKPIVRSWGCRPTLPQWSAALGISLLLMEVDK